MKDINTYIQEGFYNNIHKATHIEEYKNFSDLVSSLEHLLMRKHVSSPGSGDIQKDAKIIGDLFTSFQVSNKSFQNKINFFSKLPNKTKITMRVPYSVLGFGLNMRECKELTSSLQLDNINPEGLVDITLIKESTDNIGSTWSCLGLNNIISKYITPNGYTSFLRSVYKRDLHIIVFMLYSILYKNTENINIDL